MRRLGLDNLRLELVDSLLLLLGLFIRRVGAELHLVPLLLGRLRAAERLRESLLLAGALQRGDSLLRAQELRDGDDQSRGGVGGAGGFFGRKFIARIRPALSLVARGGGSIGDALEPLHLTLRNLRALDRLYHLLRGASLGLPVERDVGLEGARDGAHVLLSLDGGAGFVSRLPQLVHQLLHLVRVVVLELVDVSRRRLGGGFRGCRELARPGLSRGDGGLLSLPTLGNLRLGGGQLLLERLDPRPEIVALGLGDLRAFDALLVLARERAQYDDLLHLLRGLGLGLLRLFHSVGALRLELGERGGEPIDAVQRFGGAGDFGRERGSRGGLPGGGEYGPHAVQDVLLGLGTHGRHRGSNPVVRLDALLRVLVEGAVEPDGVLGGHAQVRQPLGIDDVHLILERVRGGTQRLERALELRVRHDRGGAPVDLALASLRESSGGVVQGLERVPLGGAHVECADQVLVLDVELLQRRASLR